MTVSALRNWWNTYQLKQSDSSDSSTEEDEGKLAERKLLSTKLNKTLRTTQLLIDFDAGQPVLSLRAPLDLINFQSITLPRWPIECEVVGDAIHHIEWDPSEPEPFYQATGHERTPMPSGEARGKVVYCTDHAKKHPFFTCSRVGGSRGPIKNPTCITQTDLTLEFESRIESGNLLKAVQVGVHEYELTLRADMYTEKHTQWFYFRVRNMKAGVNYRFTIINLMKSNSLYTQGMKPLLYSERAAKDRGVGWQRTGSNIRYYRNCKQETKDNSDTVTLYSLTWTMQFPHDSDTCYLAHCYPYTYSHLQRYLRALTSNPAVASYCTLRVLCHSLAGNAVYVVTVTSRGVANGEGKTKKAVVVTARVHPGETNGSWMMEGFLDFLLGDSEDAQLLRDTFVFKVVPMLNPDGVIVGNYRCSLAGRDLNRNYKTLLRDSFPCVWHTRNMVEKLVTETDVILYCDFHGHNRKNNVFMYGCNTRGDASLKLQERVFPLMMSKNASNKFSFKSCKFRVQKSKEGTGRITMWRLGVRNSYTMEASFGGSTLGDRRGTHFTTRDLKSIGFHFCDTLLDYCDPDPIKTTYCLTELAVLMRKQVREKLVSHLHTDCNISVSDLETSTSGSNSSDSDGLPAHLLKQPQASHPEQRPVKKKKKRLRTHKERNRLRPERLKNNTRPMILESRFKNISLQESDPKTGIQQRPVGRKKREGNGVTRKAVIPPPTAQPGEGSHVTLWQGCKPIKNDCLETAAGLHQMAKACPHLSRYTAATPRTGEALDPSVPWCSSEQSACLTADRLMEARRWRCSSQLLHLSALYPSSPKFIHSTLQQSPCPRHSFTSHKNYQGLKPSLTGPHRSPVYVKMVPTQCLLPSFTTDQRRFRDRNSLGVSKRHFVPEDPLTTKTKQDNVEKEEALTPETEALRSKDLRGCQLWKKTNNSYTGILPPASKPASFMKTAHPQRDTHLTLQNKHVRRFHSGSQQSTTSLEATVKRTSESAPL